ncbi:hypothetical protein QAD02_008848 [Eretmocerus hayati]|uniref:Uncharacterized protein n=1 Tax=Eretmocerus hayati TaxID=131215 RepID=A0ACC2N8F7_9HYME|nr:hypothetical protein QAD02_008848 [Eretmocerus hayati]
MELATSEVLVSAVIILILIWYRRMSTNFEFWKKRNVAGPQPEFCFGNFKEVIMGRLHPGQLLKVFYDEFDREPVIGVYSLTGCPLLIVRDPDLIEDVLIKDFHVFRNRGFYCNARVDPLNQNLLNLEYEKWRPLRKRLSPVFTSGKLKEMFYLISDCASNLEKYTDKLIDKNEPIEFRELCAKFTTQVIGACAFGFDLEAICDDDSDFRKLGRVVFDAGFLSTCRRLLQDSFPRIYSLVRPLPYHKAYRFFIKSMKKTVQDRRKSDMRRNDFVDLMIDLQDQPDKLDNIDFNDMFLAGQAIAFFGAGFETSATTMSHALYELALNQNIQDKLREEVRKGLGDSENGLSYDCIKQIEYLNQVMKETLRKYPPGVILQRKVSEPYTFNGTKIRVPEGMKVLIPVWAIHHDPEIYPDPKKFDPERFDPKNLSARHPMSFLPYGGGPHICVGARFANYQTKVGIATIISKFKLEICDKTFKEYELNPRSLLLAPKEGIYLRVSRI